MNEKNDWLAFWRDLGIIAYVVAWLLSKILR